MSRQRFDDGDRIGEERPQTLNDKTFQIGRRNALAGGLAISFSRPMLVVVLKAWVIETNETECESKASTILAKSESERVRR